MTRHRIHLDDLLKIQELAKEARSQEKKLASSKLIAYDEEPGKPAEWEPSKVDWDMEAGAIAPALATLEALLDHLAFPDKKQFVFVEPGTEPDPEPARAKLTPITIPRSTLDKIGMRAW